MSVQEVKAQKEFWYPPGGILIWMIVLTELVTFIAGLSVYLYERRSSPDLFHASQSLLDQEVGVILTLLLLSGGYFVARSTQALDADQKEKSVRSLWMGIGMGVIFLGLKGFDYFGKFSEGLTLRYDSFFSYYWLIGGFHFLHVLTAVILLILMNFAIKRGSIEREDVIAGAVFWHLCDLIWLFVYPVFYLLGQA